MLYDLLTVLIIILSQKNTLTCLCVFAPQLANIHSLHAWAQFCCKMWGEQLSVKPI